jgi:hypothetical protein
MVRQAVRQAHGPEQSRRTHHLTTLSQPVESLKVERVEGQITMTEIQNSTRLSRSTLSFSTLSRSTLSSRPKGSSQAKQLAFDLI